MVCLTTASGARNVRCRIRLNGTEYRTRGTSYAVSVASVSQVQIILIDGEKLADLMLNFGLGVTQEQVLKIYKLDNDFFDL